MLEKTPPELVSDIIDRGLAMCGGGALLRGTDKLLTKALGIPAYVVDDPTNVVVKGAVKALDMYTVLNAIYRRYNKKISRRIHPSGFFK